MTNRLLIYEATLFRNAFAEAFARPRDRLLLAIIIVLGLTWASDRLGSSVPTSLPAEAPWLAILAAPIAFQWQRLAFARLHWHAQESPLSPEALSRRTARAYLATAHAIILAPAAALAGLAGAALGRVPPVLAILFAAYAAGAALGSVSWLPKRSERTSAPKRTPAAPSAGGKLAIGRAVLRSQTRGGRRPAIAAIGLLAANFVLTIALAWLGRDLETPARIAILLLPSLAMLLATARADAGLLGFLPFAGYGPLAVALAVAALPAASFVAAAAAAAAANLAAAPGATAALAMLHGGFVLVGVARAWLLPGRHPRSVDLQIQAEFAGLGLIAFMFPPLAAGLLIWRVARLYRRHRALTWVQS